MSMQFTIYRSDILSSEVSIADLLLFFSRVFEFESNMSIIVLAAMLHTLSVFDLLHMKIFRLMHSENSHYFYQTCWANSVLCFKILLAFFQAVILLNVIA